MSFFIFQIICILQDLKFFSHVILTSLLIQKCGIQ